VPLGDIFAEKIKGDTDNDIDNDTDAKSRHWKIENDKTTTTGENKTNFTDERLETPEKNTEKSSGKGSGKTKKSSGKGSGKTKKSSGKSSGKTTEKSSGKSSEFLALIEQTPQITIPELSQLLKITTRMVEKKISKFKTQGLLERVNGRKSGYWKVNFKR